MIVANEELVLAKIIFCRCNRRPDLDTERAFCFEDPQEKCFFVAKAVDGVGYTQDQLDAIELSLASREIDLFPLDANLVKPI